MAVKWSIPMIMVARKAQTAYDSDAEAFFTAAGITDTTQKNAIDRLVKNLKGIGDLNSTVNYWTNDIGYYPMCGGSAASHAVNLRSPGTYDLTFVGSPTHASTGVDWNGSSQYARTGIIPSTVLTLNNTHIAYYSRENNTITGYPVPIGAESSTGTSPRMLIHIKSGDGNSYFDQYNEGTTRITVNSSTISRRDGLFMTSRASSTSHIAYRNSTQTGSNTTSSSNGLPNLEILVGALNKTGGGAINPQEYEPAECAWASIGRGHTGTNQSTFYSIIQAYQTDLSRNV